ncbi:MAG: hypothetical protein BZ135_02930 [Methanosphaera sp. rholeuAM6]|nr:MAG: hypothetical protein BZ135_02930 [Methanosphaera sp. rholeuAM6]
MDFDSSIEKTLDEIQKVMNTNSIIGNPIDAKDKVIIPISKTALGFGIGVANNSGNSATEVGGAGGGGSVDPVALLVVYKDIPGPNGITLVPVDKNGTPLEDLLSSIGQMAFNLLNNSKVEPASEANVGGSVDKIKTKIKSSK